MKTKEKNSLQNKIIISIIIIIATFLLFSIFSAPIKNNENTLKTNIDMKLLMDEDSINGDIEAPITIVEFSDFECPYCGVFHRGTFQEIKRKYIDTGIVKFVYRDFPLSQIHPFAQKAAEAAECAGEQDKYYEMHDKLFTLGADGGIEVYKKYAIDLELNIKEFNECLDSGKMKIEVNKDLIDGQIAGVTGTPAFFINGIFISGAQSIEVFDKIINKELEKL